LVEDAMVRDFVDRRLNRQPPYAAISSIEIERTREEVKVILKTARPGLVIGPKGAEVDKLKDALEDLTDRRVNINIVEIRSPDLDAQLVAEGIAEQLKRRASFRRAMKQRCEATMQAGAKGVKIMVSGRLGGSEMSRSETQIMGSIPLHTLEADVDYGFAPSFTTYGAIGVKVWIYRGMFAEQSSEEAEQTRSEAMTRARRRRESRPDGGGDRPRRTQRREKPATAARRGTRRKAKATTPADEQPKAQDSSAPTDEQPKAQDTSAPVAKRSTRKRKTKATAPADEQPEVQDASAPEPSVQEPAVEPTAPADEGSDKGESPGPEATGEQQK
ncbi:MAG: 30S ribosomal protein S3, partial [Planctomycetota bacterium]